MGITGVPRISRKGQKTQIDVVFKIINTKCCGELD
jgi:hypothetical protein